MRNLLSEDPALGITCAVTCIFIFLFFRKFHPPFDVGFVHPEEATVPECVGMDSMLVAVHHSDVFTIFGRIFSFFWIPGILHHIPGKGLQESGLGGIMDMIIGNRRHTLLRLHITFREVVDGSISETIFIDSEVRTFFKDV